MPVLLALLMTTVLATPPASADPVGQLDQQYTLTAASVQSQFAQVGSAFVDPAVVRVCDVNSFPCLPRPGVGVTFTAPASGASGTFAGSGTNEVTVISGGDGIATAPTFTANDTVGSFSMRVVADEPTPDRAVPNFFFFTNVAAGSQNLAASISTGDGSFQSAMVNTAFQPMSAILFKADNSFAAGVPVTFTAPDSGPSGTFATTGTNTATVTTGPTGVATAPQFTANGIPGDYYYVEATVSGALTATGRALSTPFAVRNTVTGPNGVPVVVSAAGGNGQQVGALAPFPTRLQVVVLDGSLGYVAGAEVTFTAPASGPSGTFPGGSTTFTTTTGGTGLATAPTFTANEITGSYVVNVSATKGGQTATGVIGLTNGRVRTTTRVTKEPAGTSVYGQPVVLSATVSPEAGIYVPAGPVTFSLGGTVIPDCASVPPSGGVATCTLDGGDVESAWALPGDYSYSASYFGDTLSQPSSSPAIPHTVVKADTSVTIASSEPDFVLAGDSVTFTATVEPVAPGRGVPTGTVTFTSSDGTVLNDGDPVPLAGGTAEVTTSDLAVGSAVITATYSGGANHDGSEGALTQDVYTVPTVTTDPVSQTVLVGGTATFTAEATGFPTPTVQWQVSQDDGATFDDVVDATEATYAFSPVGADDQTQYRAVFTNPAGSDETAAATLTVRQPPAFTSDDATTFTVGTAGSFAVTAGGILAPDVARTGDTLPAGVTFDETTGELAGTPSATTGGVYTLTFTADNGIDPVAVQTFTLTVDEAPAITSPDTATFTEGSPGSHPFTVGGFPAPTLSVTGTLPDGTAFDPDTGVLAGTPTETGTFPLTVTATNGVDPDATQSFTLEVEQVPGVSGTVTANGAPLSGVGVYAYADTDGWLPTASTQTAPDGTYRLDDMPPGTYRIVVVPGPGSGLRIRWYDGSDTRTDATPVTVGEATDPTGIDIALLPAASVSGTVVGPDGSPATGVRVLAVGDDDTWVPSGQTTTGADGTYRIDGLRSGTYRIVVVAAPGSGLRNRWYDGNDTRASASPVTVGEATSPTGIDIALLPAASLSGTVVGPDGSPATGIRVLALGDGDTWVASGQTTTGADGTYRIDGLRPGTYRILFAATATSGLRPEWHDDVATRTAATPHVAVAGATVEGLDAQLAVLTTD